LLKEDRYLAKVAGWTYFRSFGRRYEKQNLVYPDASAPKQV